ncbi:MAG: hypothetical protein U9Q12_01275 [Patescibacteria group bacterium]|nr:hypothetical protein [Patescibacteria group bacterium]
MKEYYNKKKYYPTLVSNIYGNKKQNEGYERVQKLHTLIQEVQNLLLSDEMVDFIYRVEKKYHLQDEQTEDFSRTVREYFFGEITEGGFAKKVSEICNITPEEALKLLSVIKTITPKEENEKGEIIQLSLNDAISKYPKITGQIITSRNIITKPFLKPLKPTVKNWIIVYEKILGVDDHSMIERGEFVFRSDATKGLSEEERNTLLILFKSRDEKIKLNIDLQEQEIIFIQKQEEKKQIVQKNTENIKKDVVQGLKTKKIQPKKEEQNIIQKKEEQIQYGMDSVNYEIQSKNPQLHKVVNDQKINAQEEKIQNNEDENKIIEQIPQEVQKEITKNRIEMKGTQKKKVNEGLNKEDVGSQSYQTQKQDDVIKISEEKIQKNPSRVVEDLGIPAQIQDTINNTDNIIQKENFDNSEKKSKKVEKKDITQGKVSFSSNHVMPAEKKQKNIQKQHDVNLKPIGYSHIEDN